MLPKPTHCVPCPLYGGGIGFSNLEGTGESGLLVIAEALGEHEEDDGLPLREHAPAGSIFQRALRELGIPRNSLLITNIVRCRPPGNELVGAPYERGAIDHCAMFLDYAVAQYQPKAILALGGTPLRELTQYPGVMVHRGFHLPSRYNIPLVATYHPALLRRGAMGTLYGAFKADISNAWQLARHGPPKHIEEHYALYPSIEDVECFYRHVVDNPTWPLVYDVETAGILGEPEPANWADKRLVQLQFSFAPGHAIVLPLNAQKGNIYGAHDYHVVAQRIMALCNPKWGWNSRLSDDIVLEANGFTLGGELHDLMNALGHLQPGWWGGGSSGDGPSVSEKGIPSQLMGLQSAASFWCPELGPWKGRTGNIQWYGARDADITNRCGIGIFRSLKAFGLMDGYRSHKLEVREVLDDLGAMGLPVDKVAQVELRAYVTTELTALQTRIQGQVPAEILSVHPKAGYKALHSKVTCNGGEPVPIRQLIDVYDIANPPLVTAAGHTGYLVPREFREADEEGQHTETRWCIERLYNPHGSSPNTKAYIRHKGYRMPRAIDSGKDTTGKLELERLAEETGDDVLRLTGEWRQMFKTGLDYTAGHWIPGSDGRVHATFRFGTASAQTTAIEPPVQTYPEHSGIAKRAKAAIRAQDGHTFVKVDMRGFHARMTGWLARDPVYYRLADFDVHSFVTAHFLKLHDAPYLLDMDDDELHAALFHVKQAHGFVRNYKVKRVVHGVTFGMKARKLYRMYSQNFENEREAQGLINLLGELFPPTFLTFPNWVENQIRNVTPCRLVSPFGHHRFFWDYDMEQATAFLPSNCSHCHIQAALVRLRASGALRRFEGVNFTHDALWMHPLISDVEECREVVQSEFNAPSTILVNNPLGAFQCNSDVEIGPSLAEMH